jgi:transcriptional regulator with PAS, ATPase and Fis domain
MRHKTSYQVLGPEHYCFALHNLAACAAPILDEHDEVLGSLLLTQPLPALPWDSDYQKLLSHTLGLITSLASAIEYHLRFRKCLTLLRTIDAQKKRVAVSKVTRSSLGDVADITFDDIMGSSPAIQKAIKLAQRYALTKESILLTGESGTGKEYFAQAIHNATCADGPFMSINCAAIPPRLIESELFGYEGGSFTGAERGGKPGKIELAHGGTLFLDEIGDMPLELQATLLRVLENKRVMRLGGKGYRQVDFRVMVATNRDLYAMTTTAAFREDLFYRLSILTIALPPLRERPEDILLFARYFIDECRRKGYDGPSDFSPGALELIKAYHWPGNVRQLKNFIFSAYCAATGDLIKLDDLPAYFQDGANAADKAGSATEVTDVTDVTDVCDVTDACDAVGTASTEGATAFSRQAPSFEPMSLAKLEEQIIQRTLAETGGNIARCAELLKVSKATLYRKLKQCDLEQ